MVMYRAHNNYENAKTLTLYKSRIQISTNPCVDPNIYAMGHMHTHLPSTSCRLRYQPGRIAFWPGRRSGLVEKQ